MSLADDAAIKPGDTAAVWGCGAALRIATGKDEADHGVRAVLAP